MNRLLSHFQNGYFKTSSLSFKQKMLVCCVCWCKFNSKDTADVHHHGFPSITTTRAAWVKFAARELDAGKEQLNLLDTFSPNELRF